jgi:alkaline phosphatase
MKHRIKTIIALTGVILCTLFIGNIDRIFPEKPAKAKYVFLFIGDGMGQSLVSLTESYMSYKAGKLGGEKLSFSNFPYTGFVTTYSANKRTTCSSAAGTAIATGSKTNNELLGMTADGVKLKSLAYDLKEDGYKIGIISTAPINHATPAAFYASPQTRNHYYEITSYIPESGFDFFAGAGFKEFVSREGGKPDSETLLKDSGYEVYWGKEEYANRNTDARKVVYSQLESKGCNAKDYFAGDVPNSENVTLPEFLEAGLEFLSDEEPFFIMCEGGTIDWAAHMNKTMPTIHLIQEMDEAVKMAYEFYLKHPDETLIIVTADHDTGGSTLGYGEDWDNCQIRWDYMDSVWNASGQTNLLDSDANRRLNEDACIGWSTSHHTGVDVPVYAIGKGAERFCGKMDNTDFKSKILAE